jgi:hypothetical protein
LPRAFKQAAPALDLGTARWDAVHASAPTSNTGMTVTLKVLRELGRSPEAASFRP